MDDSLSFDAWVLIGNALNLLLRGIPADAIADTAVRDRLTALDEALRNAEPANMLQQLDKLSGEDRALLAAACHHAYAIAEDQAETLLGMRQEDAIAVLAHLQR